MYVKKNTTFEDFIEYYIEEKNRNPEFMLQESIYNECFVLANKIIEKFPKLKIELITGQEYSVSSILYIIKNIKICTPKSKKYLLQSFMYHYSNDLILYNKIVKHYSIKERIEVIEEQLEEQLELLEEEPEEHEDMIEELEKEHEEELEDMIEDMIKELEDMIKELEKEHKEELEDMIEEHEEELEDMIEELEKEHEDMIEELEKEHEDKLSKKNTLLSRWESIKNNISIDN